MARTSIEDRADVMNGELSKFVGCHEAHSMGYLYKIWKLTQMLRIKRASKSSILLYSTCVEPLGEELANKWFEGLQLYGFIEKKGDDDYYIKGNGDHIKNLKKLDDGHEKGGRIRASTAERDEKGRLKPRKTSSSSPPARSEVLTSSVETSHQLGPNIDPAQCNAMQGNAMQGNAVLCNADISSLSGASPAPAEPMPKLPKAKKDETPKLKSEISQVWTAYKEAYLGRYNQEPPYSAKNYGICKLIIERIGFEPAKEVVRFYLTHNDAWLVKNCHMLEYCLKQCEAMYTQMKANFKVTSSFAKDQDRKQTNQQVFENFAAERGIKL